MASSIYGDKSSYNEADRKMDRIHRLQDVINTCRLNLLKYDEEANLYHYEIVASTLIGLMEEVYGKMSKDEKIKFNEFRNKITEFLDLKPIYEREYSGSFSNTSNVRIKLNVENWKELRGLLFDMEDFIRDTLDLRGFSSFNVDDDSDDPY